MSEPDTTHLGPVARFLALPNDSTVKTLGIALILCLVSSIVVSTAAVGLRERQAINKAAVIKKNILDVAGLYQVGADIDRLFAQIEMRVVELDTGEYVTGIDPAAYDQKSAAKDPATSRKLSPSEDPAQIRRRAHYATVYQVKKDGRLTLLILPIHGYGLWSTLYGFIALERDANTIYGLKFYQHAETPGMGGEVDNPIWRAQWRGKQVYDQSGQPVISVIRGRVERGSKDAIHQIDGLAGATLTSNGVTNMVRYWLGENGFGPYLAKMRK